MSIETIDDLSYESYSDSREDNHVHLSGFNFRLLLATIFTERLAYYGLRSVLILYAIDHLGIADDTALAHYGYLTLIVYIAHLFGGLLGDFLLGSRNGVLLGFGLCVVGSILITIEGVMVFYSALLLIAFGSGFIKTNIFSFIAHFSAHDEVLLEKRFISSYGAINFGAFLSSLVIAFIGERFGFVYAFLIVIFLYVLGLLFIFLISNTTNTSVLARNQRNARPLSTRSILIILLTIVGSTTFWILFEQYSMEISIARQDFFYENDFTFLMRNSWYFSVVLILLLVVPYYFLARKLPLYVKMIIALGLIGVCWGASLTLIKPEVLKLSFLSITLFMIVESIADIILLPTVNTLLALHSPKKFYGTIYSICLLILLGAQYIVNSLDSWGYGILAIIGLIILLISSIILFSVLSLKSEKTKSIPSLEE